MWIPQVPLWLKFPSSTMVHTPPPHGRRGHEHALHRQARYVPILSRSPDVHVQSSEADGSKSEKTRSDGGDTFLPRGWPTTRASSPRTGATCRRSRVRPDIISAFLTEPSNRHSNWPCLGCRLTCTYKTPAHGLIAIEGRTITIPDIRALKFYSK